MALPINIEDLLPQGRKMVERVGTLIEIGCTSKKEGFELKWIYGEKDKDNGRLNCIWF